MSLSGVILLIIVAAWAYVLVPMFLRRYDQASETAPATELQERSRVLARRCAAGSPALVTRAGTTARRPAAARSTPRPDAPSRVRRAVLVRELRSQLRSVHRGTATATLTATAPAETATTTAKATAATATATAKAGATLKGRRPAPRHRQLIRRRATLGCLSGAVAVSVAAALIVSPLAGGPAGAAPLALAGYVVHVRHVPGQRQQRGSGWHPSQRRDDEGGGHTHRDRTGQTAERRAATDQLAVTRRGPTPLERCPRLGSRRGRGRRRSRLGRRRRRRRFCRRSRRECGGRHPPLHRPQLRAQLPDQDCAPNPRRSFWAGGAPGSGWPSSRRTCLLYTSPSPRDG